MRLSGVLRSVVDSEFLGKVATRIFANLLHLAPETKVDPLLKPEKPAKRARASWSSEEVAAHKALERRVQAAVEELLNKYERLPKGATDRVAAVNSSSASDYSGKPPASEGSEAPGKPFNGNPAKRHADLNKAPSKSEGDDDEDAERLEVNIGWLRHNLAKWSDGFTSAAS